MRSEVERRLGRPVTMQELPQHVQDDWKNLSETDKQKYRSVKNRERCSSSSSSGQLDCRGVSMRELQQREDYIHKKDQDMKKDISTLVDFYSSGNALHRATFYVLSTSYYVYTDDGKYCPAEIGLLQFSLERGIMKEYNVIIKENLPLGYRYLATEHCKATHQLHELDPNDAVQPQEAFNGLCEFVVKEGGKLPPLYTLQNQLDQAEAILEALGAGGDETFTVYSLDLLMKHLYCSTFTNKNIPVSIATEMLNHCGLDYHPDIACQWHILNQEDYGKHCSLSCVRRWVYLICDNLKLAQSYRVVPQEGRHLPRASKPKGILINVPRTSVEDTHIPTQGRGENSNNMAASSTPSFTWTNRQQSEGDSKEGNDSDRLSERRRDRPTKTTTTTVPAWVRRGETTPTPAATPKAKVPHTLASLLTHTSLDTSSEDDFPCLGAGKANTRGGGGGLATLGGGGGGLATLGGVGRGISIDKVYMGAAGVGRGQQLKNRLLKK
ncbi:hypothetical protein Pmani_020262 [Petrolisthes manimaculis]|uniref:Maelstrom domain-containing protein n=1 Tax=Petrolisthes manimaculis TaxID=1843537 RepID=A0AAE1PIR9_9EUCA|nr:hypothetical protein Pmani_020262 [Petrolisthes manimaculis]